MRKVVTDLDVRGALTVQGAPITGGAGLAYTADLGAITGGSPVTVTHNLGTYDVAVEIVEKGTAGAGGAAGTLVDATVALTSVNALTVTFTSNAAANKYRVTVLASGGGGAAAADATSPFLLMGA